MTTSDRLLNVKTTLDDILARLRAAPVLDSKCVGEIVVEPLVTLMTKQRMDDQEFILDKRRRVRLFFGKELPAIQCDFSELDLIYGEYKNQLRVIREITEHSAIQESLDKVLVKAERYFHSNQFRIGWLMGRKNEIDLFKYAIQGAPSKGDLDVYISRFKVNSENSWYAFSETISWWRGKFTR